MRLFDNKITLKNERIACAILAIGSLAVCLFLSFIFWVTKVNGLLCLFYGFGFGSAVNFLFTLSYCVAGGLKNSYEIVVCRWKNFFESLKISFSYAVDEFIQNIKDEGMIFWVYVLIIISQAVFAGFCFAFLIGYYDSIM